MKRVLVITAAGLSSRFSDSLGRSVHKSLFSEGTAGSILHRLVSLGVDVGFERVIVVAGDHADDVRSAMSSGFGSRGAVEVVLNPEFASTGSYRSARLGVEAALAEGADEVTVAEGDLVFDRPPLNAIAASARDCMGVSRDPIVAATSVALYVTASCELRCVYDVSHRVLAIPEPFTAVYNSAQVWKFADAARLGSVIRAAGDSLDGQTNLELVRRYFDGRSSRSVDFVTFDRWFNCNTIADYRRAFATGDQETAAC